jgi:acyl carrier protein
LRNILADVLELSPEEVTPDMNAAAVANWDSFRLLQLILALEDEYRVQLDPQRIPELTSVSLLQTELEKKGVSL